jgi:hypothetical protein
MSHRSKVESVPYASAFSRRHSANPFVKTELSLWDNLAESFRQEIQECSWLVHLINKERIFGFSDKEELAGMNLSISDQLTIALKSRRCRDQRESELIRYFGLFDENAVATLYKRMPQWYLGLFEALCEEIISLKKQLVELARDEENQPLQSARKRIVLEKKQLNELCSQQRQQHNGEEKQMFLIEQIMQMRGPKVAGASSSQA